VAWHFSETAIPGIDDSGEKLKINHRYRGLWLPQAVQSILPRSRFFHTVFAELKLERRIGNIHGILRYKLPSLTTNRVSNTVQHTYRGQLAQVIGLVFEHKKCRLFVQLNSGRQARIVDLRSKKSEILQKGPGREESTWHLPPHQPARGSHDLRATLIILSRR
jgi:hypothetical protein